MTFKTDAPLECGAATIKVTPPPAKRPGAGQGETAMRRPCIALAALAFASLGSAAGAQPAAPQPPTFDMTRVVDGVYLYRYMAHNSLVVVDPQGVVVVDPISLRRDASTVGLAEIRKITTAPIRYLVYSHSHYDHATGGRPYKQAGATVVAHRNARDRLAKVSNPEIVPPDEVVDDRRTLTVGSRRVELIHLGPSHSDNMLVTLLPQERIIFTVDWVGGPFGAPGFDMWPDEWVQGLQRLLTLDWDTMVLGHTNRRLTKADVQTQIDYMNEAKAQAKTIADGGRCTAEGRAAVAVPTRFSAYAQTAQWDGALSRYCQYWNQGY